MDVWNSYRMNAGVIENSLGLLNNIAYSFGVFLISSARVLPTDTNLLHRNRSVRAQRYADERVKHEKLL